MANPEHVEIVRAGASSIAQWRGSHSETRLDLTEASLQGLNLREANLEDADCRWCTFAGSNLSHANFRHANLYDANLCRVDLRGADFQKANLEDARLEGARLAGAQFGATILRNTDFSGIEDLAEAHHAEVSVVDEETLAKSGKLPRAFLQGIGVPEPTIVDVFLSYATKDEGTAREIATHLRSAGLTVFISSESLVAGDVWAETTRRNLVGSREVCVLCSLESMRSQWVLTEIGAAWALQKTITPILVDLQPTELPDRLSEIQAIRLADLPRGVEAIVSRVQQLR